MADHGQAVLISSRTPRLA
jgi:hypothetical protein